MAVNVLGNTTAASTSVVRPRASVAVVDPSAALTAVLATANATSVEPVVGVTVVDPTASVSYSLPASAVSYAELGAYTTLDVTERFKFFPDYVSLADSYAVVTHKLVSELSVTNDKAIRSVEKLLSDGVAMNDTFGAGDGAVYSFAKGISNVTMVDDVTTKTPAKALAEQIDFSDSGVLLAQGYCDFTYFAEDYVGARIVF